MDSVWTLRWRPEFSPSQTAVRAAVYFVASSYKQGFHFSFKFWTGFPFFFKIFISFSLFLLNFELGFHFSSKFCERGFHHFKSWASVTDLEFWSSGQCCGSGMFIPDPGSEFFHSGSRVKNIQDPGCAFKNLSIFNQKKLFLSSRKNDPVCSSRIPGSKRQRIPDLDPQHWFWVHYLGKLAGVTNQE